MIIYIFILKVYKTKRKHQGRYSLLKSDSEKIYPVNYSIISCLWGSCFLSKLILVLRIERSSI